MKNKELLPCPFCGGEAEVAHLSNMPNVIYVWCKCCGASTKGYAYSKTAIRKWNTRTNTIPVGNGKDYTVVNE